MTYAVDMSGPLWGRTVCYNVEERERAQAEAARVIEAERQRIEQFDPSSLSETELIAMMSCGHDTRHQAIFWGLRERGDIGRIPFDVLTGLRERGLIEKPEGKRFHVLTAEGRLFAGKIADHLVDKKHLHFAYGFHQRSGRYHGSVRCTCKWSQTVSSFNFQSNANRAFSGHIARLEAAKMAAG